MIAIDSSAFARFLAAVDDRAAGAVAEALDAGEAHFPPVVLTELLSNPAITERNAARVAAVPLLSLSVGYWERAGLLRANLHRDMLKAQVPDCLIAQVCLDHDIPLITYDRDFRHFVRAGLKLL